MTEITISVRATNGDKFSVRTDTEKTVAELKTQVETESKIPVAQQRLIYSGKVLKDTDKLADVGIKDGVSIHLVKGAAKAPAAASPSAPSAANSGSAPAQPAAAAPPPQQQQQQQQQQMPQANPFAGMFGAGGMGAIGGGAGMGMGGGAAGGFPGLPPGMDLQQMFAMMQNPAMQQMMNQVMSNPALLQAMIAGNPMLQQMMAGNPMMAQAMNDPQFMNNMFAGGMPGMPGAPPAGAGAGAGGQQPDLNAMLQNLGAFQAAGGAGGGAGGAGDLAGLLAALGGPMPAAQNSAVPPEQRFANQLDQLGEMGFVERDRCVAALLATNGNVPAAVERLLSGLN